MAEQLAGCSVRRTWPQDLEGNIALTVLFPRVLNKETVLGAGIDVRIKWDHVYKPLGQSLGYS